ncbi:hypothetical protein V5O48_004930 [Marasmius crinis-equi]|uniref:NACHT domain-containing protein n=1 Tax=Marasmius crinis-equi TaxID=585013 RepID=A0ABR3FNY7_9AGAR
MSRDYPEVPKHHPSHDFGEQRYPRPSTDSHSRSSIARSREPGIPFIPPLPSPDSRFWDAELSLAEQRAYFAPPPRPIIEEISPAQPESSSFETANHPFDHGPMPFPYQYADAEPYPFPSGPFSPLGPYAHPAENLPPPPRGPQGHYSMFSRASNLTITGGLFSNVGGDVVNNTYNSMGPSDEIHLDQYLRGFCAMNAAYNSGERQANAPRCIPKTRTEVIRTIATWVSDPSSPGILWLSGLAGEGKSAVAQTVAEHFSSPALPPDSARLAGSFFFSRGQDDRRQTVTVFITLAYQLMRCNQTLKRLILKALEDDSSIPHSHLADQFARLVVYPVLELNTESLDEGRPPISQLLFVIEALDECDDPTAILTVIANALMIHGNLFKFLITSRPESHIRDLFSRPDVSAATRVLALGDYDSKHDVELYLTHSFLDIKSRNASVFRLLNSRKQDWPERPVLARLAHECDGLFVYASSMIQFVSHERESPVQRLQRLLSLRPSLSTPQEPTLPDPMTSENPYAHLDNLYTHILSAVQGPLDLLRDVLGTFIVLFTPLSEPDFLALVTTNGSVSEESVCSITNQLHSILAIHWSAEEEEEWKTQPVKLYHKAIHEFLTDQKRSAKFYVSPTRRHRDLALLCLHIMSTELKRNICQIKQPAFGIRNLDVENLEERRNRFIPGSLRYACRFWWQHTCSAFNDGSDEVSQSIAHPLEVFLESSLLTWIECLSLLGDLSIALQAVRAFGDHDIRSKCKPKVSTLIADCGWLLLGYYLRLASCSYAVYEVTLNRAPQESIVRRLYRKAVDWHPLHDYPGVTRTWDEHFSRRITARMSAPNPNVPGTEPQRIRGKHMPDPRIIHFAPTTLRPIVRFRQEPATAHVQGAPIMHVNQQPYIGLHSQLSLPFHQSRDEAPSYTPDPDIHSDRLSNVSVPTSFYTLLPARSHRLNHGIDTPVSEPESYASARSAGTDQSTDSSRSSYSRPSTPECSDVPAFVETSDGQPPSPFRLPWSESQTDGNESDSGASSDSDSYYTAEEDHAQENLKDEWKWNYDVTPPEEQITAASDIFQIDKLDWKLGISEHAGQVLDDN